MHGVVRLNKGREHFAQSRLVQLQLVTVLGKLRPIPQVSTTTHHGQIDAEATGLRYGHNDVDILRLMTIHDLRILCVMQRLDLIAELGRLFEGQSL